ncbi:MAG: T9SS type A sorting domain-containing protein, partial [Flavobacteriales bacterium]|nr:T9SS type A sorting domain-containing protein [Flavobacteriales bacterium]
EAVGFFPADLICADLNNDGWMDIATVDQTGNTVSVLLNTTVNGIHEQVSGSVRCYPNPARDAVQLSWELPGAVKGSCRLSVVSAHGQVVSTVPIAPGDKSYVLDVSNYAAGLYHLHLVVGGQWVSAAKVVIE